MADEDEELTIDELAQRTGMTVRNVRAHQSRGLLPPPALRGRTGIYGADHVARLELIRDLQAEGFNLEGIRRLLESTNGSSAELLRFTRTVRAPFDSEPGREVQLEDLIEAFGAAGDPKLLERAMKMGLYRPLGDGWVEEVSPTLGRAAQELGELGIPLETALDTASRMRKATDSVAKTFVQLFIDEVWKPFDDAGRPPERWPEVQAALERLRPIAAEATVAMFRIVMDERVEQAFGRVLDKPTRG